MVSVTRPSTSTTRATAWAELASVFEPWCNIVHLERSLEPDIQRESQGLVQQNWDECRVVLRGNGAEDGVCGSALNDELVRSFGSELRALQDDVLFLSEVLRDLTGAEAIGVRLMRLEKAACPNLHFDRVGLRLVTTYCGPGTDYLPDRWTASDSPESANLRGRKNLAAVEESVECTRAGDVLLLKGTLWPGNEEHGAVHRSPETLRSEPRIVATLDPL